MPPQTTVTASPASAYPGLQADAGFTDIVSVRIDAALGIAPGLVALATDGGDSAAGFPTSVALAVDAILTPLATSASQQVIDTEANGVIGLGRIFPMRKITIARSANAAQDAVSAVLRYLSNGVLYSQTLAFADGGGDSFASTFDADRFVDLTIPAQSGVGGTTTIGVAAASELHGFDVLGVIVRDFSKASETPALIDSEVFGDGEVAPCMKHGRINVVVENNFRRGDRVYVRLVATGAEKLGSVRVHDTDGGDCVPWYQARLCNSGVAGAFGILELDVV